MKNFLSKTRESSLHNSKSGKNTKIFFWIFVVCTVLFFSREIVSTLSSALTTPFYFVHHYIQTSGATVPVFVRSRMELLDQIRGLEEKVLSQAGVDTTLQLLTIENNELRGLLGASSSPRIAGGVIARPPYTPYDTLIIDRGSAEGVLEDAPVFYGANRALGYVRKTFEHHALVTLFSSPGVESTVYVFGSNFFTTAYGEGGGVIRLSVPQGVAIKPEDVVILPSLDTGILGTIDHIQSIPTEPEQHAYVTFDVPLQSIRVVGVGITPVLSDTTFMEAKEAVQNAEHRLFTIPIPPEERFEGQATTSVESIQTGTTTTTSTPAL